MVEHTPKVLANEETATTTNKVYCLSAFPVVVFLPQVPEFLSFTGYVWAHKVCGFYAFPVMSRL